MQMFSRQAKRAMEGGIVNGHQFERCLIREPKPIPSDSIIVPKPGDSIADFINYFNNRMF